MKKTIILNIDEEELEQVKELAEEDGTSVQIMLKRLIRISLKALIDVRRRKSKL